ncbi:thiamine pyrophosphate-binding protein [Rhodoferax sp.]|uniref:thiamine pyrophosphate-binding protein n=1 Tax=Rhodoferax sp. TaxID=50421 RepID=UPI00276B4776|nr:thiamine pyrophosphate-binding protein [Rhodoferax sp.]
MAAPHPAPYPAPERCAAQPGPDDHGGDDSVAAVIVRFLLAQGVTRLFTLCGGHIMPIFMGAARAGLRLIDVRDERAAVYMAHAHSELTGELGVALVTAGPGVTNAITGIANAHVARASVLVLSGTPAQPQDNRGALQDLPHTELVRPITRYARTVRAPALVLQELGEALARARGQGGDPGPVYLDFPVDVLRAQVPRVTQLAEHFAPRSASPLLPDPAGVERAVELLWSARRPLVISGRGARGAGALLCQLLERCGALYLDTGESRGLVSDTHPAVVAAMRARAMGEADLVLTLGRRLDFQLAYGSPAVFGEARFIRIADAPSELRDNRRASVELFAQPAAALAAMLAAAGDRPSAVDREWAVGLRRGHEQRVDKLRRAMQTAEPDEQGRMHPNRLLAALQQHLSPDAVLVADGGDFLSFARVGLSTSTYLDPGALGCIGVGTAFGVAASLAFPGRQVVVATGDGAFGFNAMEIDTAVRHQAKLLIVVANNGAWQIEVNDQTDRYQQVVATRLQFADHAAMARAFGMFGQRVERIEQLDAALATAMQNLPALLDVVVSTQARSADSLCGLARVPDLQAVDAWDNAERNWRQAG